MDIFYPLLDLLATNKEKKEGIAACNLKITAPNIYYVNRIDVKFHFLLQCGLGQRKSAKSVTIPSQRLEEAPPLGDPPSGDVIHETM